MDAHKQSDYQKAYKAKYNTRHKRVSVTLTLAEYRQLKEAAKQQKTKPTSLLKELAFASLNDTDLQPTELVDKLNEHNRLVRSIANNLNQIAHHANIFSEVDKKTVFDHLRKLHTQVEYFIKDANHG